MKKSIFLISLIFLIFCSFSVISASEVDNSTLNAIDVGDYNSISDLSENSNLALDSEDEILDNGIDETYFSSENDESITIYVGKNITEDGGNGSSENPFGALNLACDYANAQNKSQTIVNIYNGTYYLDSYLKFNTSNLIINGINGNAIIKNAIDDIHITMAFGLDSPTSTFTMNNLIYDTNGYQYGKSSGTTESIFTLFVGNANLGTFNNCSFLGLSAPRLTCNYDSVYNNCYFEGDLTNMVLYLGEVSPDRHLRYEYCSFNLPNCPSLISGREEASVTMVNCWLGKNTFPTFIQPPRGYIVNSRNRFVTGWSISVEGYAQFNVAKNYISNNTYEIIGKLTWDDENNTVSMENFQPMNISLSSNTGKIQSSVILTNGTFRAIYTGDSSEHSIVAILSYELKELNFKSINFTVNAPGLFYGEDQNITITFPNAINATINILVNNKTYNLTVNDTDSVIYTIEDIILTEGNYTVEVILSDDINQVYGSNSTILSISKVRDYIFEVVPVSEVKVGENATINITLPSDVSGNVTVKFGNDTQILPANQTLSVQFGNLNATTYPIIVSYSGNDKYAVPNDKIDSITVDPAKSSINIENVEFIYGEYIVIPFTFENASAVKAKVLKGTSELGNVVVENTNIFVNSDLDVGKYTVEVTTIVSSNYEETTETAILTINKANSTLIISDNEFIYGEDAIVNVETVNSTADVIATLMDENNVKIAVTVSGNNVILPLLNVGKYTLTVTTNVDGNHNNFTNSATITITKATPLMNVIIQPTVNITVKDNVTLTVKLPSDASGDVVIKINGKKLYNVSANETITINLSQTSGDYVVDTVYSGDKNYESDMATKEFTVSKAETSITAKQIAFEEGNASTIEVTIPDVDSGIVLVDVAGKKFYGDINNRKAIVTLDGLSEGNYTANIKFFGDEKYNEATCTADVKVSEDKIITELKEQLEEAQANATSLANDQCY